MGGLLAAGQPDYWAGRAGLSCAWAGCWMGLGLRLVAGWAGPEATRRHVRHASRPEASLRLAYFETMTWGRREQEIKALASLCLGSRTEGLGHTSDRLSSWRSLRPVTLAGQAGLRWVAGWAGPEASLSHKAAKPWVGCWLPGSRTTLLVAPGTWAGQAGLSCAWVGC